MNYCALSAFGQMKLLSESTNLDNTVTASSRTYDVTVSAAGAPTVSRVEAGAASVAAGRAGI